MADNFELDFGDFSPDFDLDYDFGSQDKNQKKSKKKGDVIKDFASGLWEGFSGSITGYGVPQRLIKSMLPRAYGPALDSIDRTLRFKDDLYDKVRENTKESVTDFKELTREALGAYGGKIPEKLAKRLEDWANSGNNESWRDYVTEDRDALDVDADTSDLLQAMTYGSAATAELSQAQHTELMATLAAGAVANQKDSAKQSVILDQILTMQRRLVGHTESITTTFQRRSLELQFRHYKLDISIARMQEQYYKRSLEAFSNMITNSTLTDLEKASKSPGHQKLMQKQTGTGVIKQTFSRYGNHLYDSLYGMADNASQNVNNRWSAAARGAAAAMRAGQQARMSGAFNGARNKGALVGTMAASAMPFLLQQLVRNRMEASGSATGLGHNLSYYAESAPGLINGWLRNRKQFDEYYNEFDPNNKWYTRLQKGVLNPLMNNALFSMPITQGNKTRVTTPGVKDLMQPTQWDLMQRRTLVEVIPGLLTQQLTTQQKLVELWGGGKSAETAFNHKQGAFTTKARVKADVRSSIFNRSEFQSAAGSFNSMVEAIDPEEELSPNARVALAMRFARDADAGDGFNINNYLSESGWINTDKDAIREINDFLHARFETKEATGKAKIFGKYQIGDTKEVAELRKRVATNMQSQMNYMPNVQDSVNSLANGGQRALLKEMGIIQRVNGQEVFNHDMYWEMMQKFISNPNFRPDLEEDPNDLLRRVDKGAVSDLKDKAKAKIKGGLDDLGVTDAANNAKDRVNDVLGRGKDAAAGATERLRTSMTKDALNDLYDNAIEKYDDLVSQLQRLAHSGNDMDIRVGIAEVKERAAETVRHIRKQLAGSNREELGEAAYNAVMEQGEQLISSLNRQIDTLDISTLRSGVAAEEAGSAKPLADIVTPPPGAARVSQIDEPVSNQPQQPAPEVTLAEETNDLLKELISISASSRDQITATKDATMAQITGDPNLISEGVQERKGFLKSLGDRMKSREASKVAKMVGLGKLYSSGVFTVTKWATIGPAYLGWKATKGLWSYFRKKKEAERGDVDGDGLRENSWLARLRRKKEEKPEAPPKDDKPRKEPTSIFGLLSGIWGGVTGMFDGIKKFGILGGLANFLGLGWIGTLVSGIGTAISGLGKLILGKKAAETVGDIVGDAADAGDLVDGDGKKGKKGREGKTKVPKKRGLLNRMVRKVVGGTAKAIKNEPSRMAGRASWLIKGGAKTLARRIPMVGAVGLGAFEMYQAYQDNDGLGMADSAGGMAGGLAGAAAGAAIGSVVPIVGTFIGGVVGGAIGAMGGSAIGSSLYKWARSPGLLQQMRLYQYGLNSIDGDYTGKIFALEEACEPYVKLTDSGKAMLDPKLPLAKLAQPFINDPNDRDEVESFGGWFVHRFKPVFLTHFAVAKQMFPSVKFEDIDGSNDSAAKYEMARRCQQFDESIDHPYRWSGILFNTQPALDYDQTTQYVQEVVDKLKAGLKDRQKTTTKTTSLMTTGDEDRARAATIDKGVVDAIKPTDGKTLKGVNTDGHTVSGGWGQEVTVVTAQDVLGSILPKKGEPLDDLTAARMKIYGLGSLDVSRVSVLLQLELVMQNRIQFNGRGATFSGKTKEVFDIIAASFGHGWLSIGAFGSWSKWFSRRFLPAYLAFASAVKNQVGEDQPTIASKNLPPETKLAIINAMTSATYNDGRDEKSIWTVADNPWSDWVVTNTDASILDAHLNNLKALAKTAQYEANDVKGGVKQTDGTTDKDWRPDKSTGQQTTNAVRGTDGLVRSSQRQETVYDPKTGKTTGSYGGGGFGADNAGAAASGAGGLDTTGKVEPLKLGPGTEEGARAMIREAVKSGVTDKKELAIMLANTHHETGGFKNVEENLRYKPQTLMKLWPHRFPTMEKASAVAGGGPVVVANTIYGNRMGNDEPGDGWKYRGRGFIQLTGKDNYQRASKALGVDLVSDPDQVAEDPTMAASSALYFWKANKRIGEQARAGNVAGVRKIVNGGTIGLEDTQKLAQQYAQMLNSGEYDDIISGKDKGETGTTSDGGESMEDMMGKSAQEQAAQSGAAPEGSSTNASPPPAGAATGDASASSAAPPGSTTNAAPPPGAPSMQSTTGPSAAAETNATSVTPNAKDSTASAEVTPFNKNDLQPQTPLTKPEEVKPVPVTMEMDDTHSKSTAENTASMAEKMDQMLEALNAIAGTNKQMAEKETQAPPAVSPVQPPNPQQTAKDFRSQPVGTTNQGVSLKRTY